METNSQWKTRGVIVSIKDLDKAQHSVAMEKNLENYDLVLKDANVKLQNKNADNVMRWVGRSNTGNPPPLWTEKSQYPL